VVVAAMRERDRQTSVCTNIYVGCLFYLLICSLFFAFLLHDVLTKVQWWIKTSLAWIKPTTNDLGAPWMTHVRAYIEKDTD